MKITVDVDISPQELREFLGLPNLEKIQTQLVKNAEAYLEEASTSQYGDFIAMAMQPMLAYQQWLQRMMTGGESRSAKSAAKSATKSTTKTGTNTKGKRDSEGKSR